MRVRAQIILILFATSPCAGAANSSECGGFFGLLWQILERHASIPMPHPKQLSSQKLIRANAATIKALRKMGARVEPAGENTFLKYLEEELNLSSIIPGEDGK